MASTTSPTARRVANNDQTVRKGQLFTAVAISQAPALMAELMGWTRAAVAMATEQEPEPGMAVAAAVVVADVAVIRRARCGGVEHLPSSVCALSNGFYEPLVSTAPR